MPYRIPPTTSTKRGPMIAYVTLGTNDLPRAAAFYDAITAKWASPA